MDYDDNEGIDMVTRKHYTGEFKLEVIRMVIDQSTAISKLRTDLSIRVRCVMVEHHLPHYLIENGFGMKRI